MAEAEDVIVDAARHATVFAQQLWRRHRRTPGAPLELADVAPRLALLLAALYGGGWPLRIAQSAPPVTLLAQLFTRQLRPWPAAAVPATDGAAIWLPRQLTGVADAEAPILWRAMALQQATRAARGAPAAAAALAVGIGREIFLVLEAEAADAALLASLPGCAPALLRLRAEALLRRPPLDAFAIARQPLEQWLRQRLASPIGAPTRPGASFDTARRLAAALSGAPLFKDWWTGELLAPAGPSSAPRAKGSDDEDADDAAPLRSAYLTRRPTVREPDADEDDAELGVWMVQGAQPQESAEDPHGLQRPTDRDDEQVAESHAESVSDLAEARLVRSAQRAKEVLLSDDAPLPGVRAAVASDSEGGGAFAYPEWDWRAGAYRTPGATVHELPALPGPREWVERTLAAQHGLVATIRRRFELLRAQRVVQHRQFDGDDLDIDACIEARADFLAGQPLAQRLYRRQRRTRRDIAVLLLADASGSTDGWVAGRRRVIDVEREALLLVSLALDSLAAPYAIDAFSGRGPQRVTVRALKRFDEQHGDAVALRIAGLEPEHYTRAGAAIRHASARLARQPAAHRLLVLLSDGKPNDIDDYEGRYGVEDMRQAVLEARAQGLSLFCLTIDRHGADYLARVFGPGHYALLQHPERLTTVLLEWMRRLLVT